MKQLKNTLFITVGTMILAFGISVFILPNNLVVGGVSGIAIMIKSFMPCEPLSVDILVSLITWAFFIVGIFTLGIPFATKTLLSTILYTTFLPIFSYLYSLLFVERTSGALLLSATLGGVFVGAGCALTFIGGGSTGGVDIIALTLCKYFPRLKSSFVIFVTDFTVVLFGAYAVKNPFLTALGIVSASATAISLWFFLLLFSEESE